MHSLRKVLLVSLAITLAITLVSGNSYAWKIGSLPEQWSNILYGKLSFGSSYPKGTASSIGWIFASVYQVSDKQFAVKGEYSVQKSCTLKKYIITIIYESSTGTKRVSYDKSGCQTTFNFGGPYLTPKEISSGKWITVKIEDKYNPKIAGLIQWRI